MRVIFYRCSINLKKTSLYDKVIIIYYYRTLDLTSDVQSLVDFAQGVPSTTGGDAPEV